VNGYRDQRDQNPPAVIQALIDAHINRFNTHDNDLFLRVFGDTAIIIDGIAPFRWLNPNAREAEFGDYPPKNESARNSFESRDASLNR